MGTEIALGRGAGTGAGRERRIRDAEHLHEEFTNYTLFAEENLVSAKTKSGEKVVPWTITSFCTYLGVSNRTWNKWRSERDDLKEAIEIVEDRIVDHLQRGGLANGFHPGLVGLAIERHANKRAAQAALAAPLPTTPPQVIANTLHPDMTEEQQELILEAGLELPLYPQTLLDQGIPFHMPALPKPTVADDD